MSWKAVYTKPRHEKKVVERLQSQGVEVFFPVQTVLKQWSDRKKKVIEPVFKSYVFLKCKESEELQILQTQGVVQFVRHLKRVAQIRDCEIEIIKSFLDDYQDVTVEELGSWEVGDQVRVSEGSMKDVSGEILYIKDNKAHLVLNEMGIQLIAIIHLARLSKA